MRHPQQRPWHITYLAVGISLFALACGGGSDGSDGSDGSRVPTNHVPSYVTSKLIISEVTHPQAGTPTVEIQNVYTSSLMAANRLAIHIRSESGEEHIIPINSAAIIAPGVFHTIPLPAGTQAWGTSGGCVELRHSAEFGGNLMDYIKIGNGCGQRHTWSGSIAFGADKSKSLSRKLSGSKYLDTNASSDWEEVRSSVGEHNDVFCSTDNDGDGIPDCSEQPGSTYAGYPLYTWGARTGQKDIFIEVDYMAKNVVSEPLRAAFDKFVAVFNAKGIKVHLDAGDYFDKSSGTDPADYDLGGGNKIPYSNCIGLSKDGCANTITSIKYKGNFDLRRTHLFYYMILADMRSVSNKSSGVAEGYGNDSIITLGHNVPVSLRDIFYASLSDLGKTAFVNMVSATMLHEFGHNLGLYHGGNEHTNYKPNYVSVMNYVYQLSGLPPTLGPTNDRYYYRYLANTRRRCGTSLIESFRDLANHLETTTFKMDFSNGRQPSLNELNLNENTGLLGSATDFNCNGAISSGVVADINYDGQLSTLSDYNDWGNIRYYFANPSSTGHLGIQITSSDLLDQSADAAVRQQRAHQPITVYTTATQSNSIAVDIADTNYDVASEIIVEDPKHTHGIAHAHGLAIPEVGGLHGYGTYGHGFSFQDLIDE